MLYTLPKEHILLIHSACLLVIILYLWLRRAKRSLGMLASAFIIAGSVANYLDRIFYGAIIDMLRVTFFKYTLFICNLGDIYLSIGALLTIASCFQKPEKPSRFEKYGLEKDRFGL